jgi:hypothetical protein
MTNTYDAASYNSLNEFRTAKTNLTKRSTVCQPNGANGLIPRRFACFLAVWPAAGPVSTERDKLHISAT